MWDASGLQIQMAEGDFGVALPVIISGAELGANDSLKFLFKTAKNGALILEKDFDGITDNTVQVEFTEAESALFPIGKYVYSLDWYQDGNFLCNIIPVASFTVVDKA